MYLSIHVFNFIYNYLSRYRLFCPFCQYIFNCNFFTLNNSSMHCSISTAVASSASNNQHQFSFNVLIFEYWLSMRFPSVFVYFLRSLKPTGLRYWGELDSLWLRHHRDVYKVNIKLDHTHTSTHTTNHHHHHQPDGDILVWKRWRSRRSWIGRQGVGKCAWFLCCCYCCVYQKTVYSDCCCCCCVPCRQHIGMLIGQTC